MAIAIPRGGLLPAEPVGPISVTPLEPSFDLIELLPPGGADRLRRLRQRGADAHALIPSLESRTEANNARLDVEAKLRRLVEHPQNGGFNLPKTDQRVVAAERLVEKLTAEATRLAKLNSERTAAWRTQSRALVNVELWLRDGRPRNTILTDYEGGPEPKLTKSETVTDAIERYRRRAGELKESLRQIERAPLPRAMCKQKAREQIEALAARGEADVTALARDGDITWPMQALRAQLINAPGAVAFTESEDVLALFTWIHKDAVLARINSKIDATISDENAMAPEDRAEAAAETISELLECERQESALVWKAQSEGLPAEHRGDIDPLALLSLALITAPLGTWPGTSPQHVLDIRGPRR